MRPFCCELLIMLCSFSRDVGTEESVFRLCNPPHFAGDIWLEIFISFVCTSVINFGSLGVRRRGGDGC